MPRTIALDTSRIDRLIRGVDEGDAVACRIDHKLREHEWVLALVHHHVAELVAHASEDICGRRLRFLRSLPMIARVRRFQETYDGHAYIGTLFDVLACELAHLVENVNATLSDAARSVRETLFVYTPGSEAIDLTVWWQMREARTIWGAAEKDRELTSVLHSVHGLLPDLTVGQLRRMSLSKDREVMARNLRKLRSELAVAMERRKDANLQNPQSILGRYMQGMQDIAEDIAASSDCVFDALVRMLGFNPGDLEADRPWSSVVEEFDFRLVLGKVMTPRFGPAVNLPSGRRGSVPSWRITRGLRAATHQSSAKSKGSNLEDEFLATICPYVDCFVADNATAEHLRQAARREIDLAPLVACVHSASTLEDIDALLK